MLTQWFRILYNFTICVFNLRLTCTRFSKCPIVCKGGTKSLIKENEWWWFFFISFFFILFYFFLKDSLEPSPPWQFITYCLEWIVKLILRFFLFSSFSLSLSLSPRSENKKWRHCERLSPTITLIKLDSISRKSCRLGRT